MKLLLYCIKAKPYLYKTQLHHKYLCFDNKKDYALNGKIVAECDFEVEEIELKTNSYEAWFATKTLNEEQLREKSFLRLDELYNYLEPNDYGYAIHIKNLHIFDEPKELSDFFTKRPYNDINKIFTDEYMKVGEWYRPITNAPQNMMYAYEVVPFKEEHLFRGVLQEFRGNRVNEYILISIQPQWLCKILNGEKTIEVRKKVLKEML